MDEMFKQNKYMIALDVGGSYIKTSVLNGHSELVPDTLSIFPSKAKASKEVIMNHLVTVIKEQLKKVPSDDQNLLGVGFAFPGPFDYENGISYIKGVDKFDALYGVNLQEALMGQIKSDPFFSSRIADEFVIAFENDANLFALGEQMSGHGQGFTKAIYLTLGTGAGSAFMDQGQLVKSGKDVPENGWIYKDPFGASIVDDYISKRGILKLAKDHGIEIEDGEVKTLAEMANNNNQTAQKVFHIFGENIGKALNPYIQSFAPQAIILGGQISKSIDLFIDGIQQTLNRREIVIKCSNDTSASTFIGIGALINNQHVHH